MFHSRRALARERTKALLGETTAAPDTASLSSRTAKIVGTNSHGWLKRQIAQAGLTISPATFLIVSFTLGAVTVIALESFVHRLFLPICFCLSAYLPLHWLHGRSDSRAADFAADYPSVLMATASSIQVGLTPLLALERATKLLPPSNSVHKEISRLLEALRLGSPKQVALSEFAQYITLPELELFRSAFALALDNGGRFAPTLQRLAQVSADRAMLIKSARVSTANMRMTANVLLAITPFIVLTVAVRTENYWHVLFTNPTANFLASLGGGIIALGYLTLRRMSAFKP